MFIYVLKLYYGKYYVGKTSNPKFRLSSHFNANGSAWTKKYKPAKVLELIPNCDEYDEDKYTIKYMKTYGIDNVRGGSFCQLALTNEHINTIEKMINGATNRCYKCNQEGHFANECKLELEKYERDAVIKLKKNFLRECQLINKNSCILTGDEILAALNKVCKSNTKLTNIYGMCQTISCCNDLTPITNYRNGINCNNFIDGLAYIIINDPKICNECQSEECYCEKPKVSYKNRRYGRKGHAYKKEYMIDSDEEESDEEESNYDKSDKNDYKETFCCNYCNKTFSTKKGATYHENFYCKAKKFINKKH